MLNIFPAAIAPIDTRPASPKIANTPHATLPVI